MNRKKFWLPVILAVVAVGALALVFLPGDAGDVPPEMTAPVQTLPPETTLPPQTQPQKQTIDTVPRYLQTDYPYTKYGNGTIGTSGCSITCLAMVASYMTDQPYYPDQIAYHFGSYGKTNIERLEYGTAQMQLPCEKNFDWQVTKQALKEGKVAIVMVNERSLFTNSQHFIVLAGITREGKILVNDPYGPNYDNPYLAERYEKGFGEPDIVKGLCGAWVYDKSAMPEEPFLFDASMPEQQENRYEGYVLTGEDIYTLACFAWAEAKDQPFEVQQAVVEVVLNRLMSDRFPNQVKKILFRDDLYHAAQKMRYVEEPELEQYLAVNAAMYGPYLLPEDVLYYSTWSPEGKTWGMIGDYHFFYSR